MKEREFTFSTTFSLPSPLSDLKVSIIRRRRLRKRYVKSEVALLQTLSRLFHLVQFIKCWLIFLELNSEGPYRRSGKKKESRCLAFSFSTKSEMRHFHFVDVQRRQRNVQKRVMHLQSCCSANENQLLFHRPCCRCCRRRRFFLGSLKAP